MKQEEIMKRARQVAEALAGCEVMEAVDVLGQGCVIVQKEFGSKAGSLTPIYYIAKVVSECNAREGVVRVNDDGTVSFTLNAAKGKKIEIL